MIEGVSHGGFATSDIVQSIPDRVLGYFEDKGTTYLNADPPQYDAISKVPGVMLMGATDNTVPPPYIGGSFDTFRSINARVAQEIDWVGHQNTDPDKRFSFFDQVYRLPTRTARSRRSCPCLQNSRGRDRGWIARYRWWRSRRGRRLRSSAVRC